MKRAALILSVLLIPGLIAGCSTISVKTDYDTSADFADLKTYKWASYLEKVSKAKQLDDSLLDTRVRNAVNSVLRSKGYREAEFGTPDFLVEYHAAVQEKTDTSTIDSPYYGTKTVKIKHDGSVTKKTGFYTSFGGPQTITVHYEEGTIIVDMVNPKTNTLLWRGSASEVIRPHITPEERDERVYEAVEKLLEKFPPQ